MMYLYKKTERELIRKRFAVQWHVFIIIIVLVNRINSELTCSSVFQSGWGHKTRAFGSKNVKAPWLEY